MVDSHSLLKWGACEGMKLHYISFLVQNQLILSLLELLSKNSLSLLVAPIKLQPLSEIINPAVHDER